MSTKESRHLFIMEKSGLDEALWFALQTMRIYRKAVLDKRRHPDGRVFTHASLRQYRREFIQSYLVFKRFILQHNKGIT